MRILFYFLAGLLFLTFAAGEAAAQKRKITVILVRHAEKDISENADSANPDLSAEGRQRAERLVQRIKRYKPMRIYSTDFRRTMQTATPLSKKRKLPIQIYDPRRQDELVRQVLSFRKSRRVVIVGHSNSIPALANLFVRQNRYKPLDDSEYGQIWIIRVKKGKVRDRVINY